MFNVQGVKFIDFAMYSGKLCVEQNFCSNPKHSKELTHSLHRLCPKNRLTITTKCPLNE